MSRADALAKRTLWLWNTKPDTIGERSFDALAATVHGALGFDGLKVKLFDGPRWQGRWGMGGQAGTDFPALTDVVALARWAHELEHRGVEFHATGRGGTVAPRGRVLRGADRPRQLRGRAHIQ